MQTVDFHCIVSSNTKKHDAANSALFAMITLQIFQVVAVKILQP